MLASQVMLIPVAPSLRARNDPPVPSSPNPELEPVGVAVTDEVGLDPSSTERPATEPATLPATAPTNSPSRSALSARSAPAPAADASADASALVSGPSAARCDAKSNMAMV
jgi:hypothetical protein